MRNLFSLLVVAALAPFSFGQLADNIQSDLGETVPPLKVRPGYRVTRAVPEKAIKEARFLEFSDDGKTLFLSQREAGAILALRDPDQGGVFKTITTFVKDRRSAHGM